MQFLPGEIKYLAHHVSKEGVWPSKGNPEAVSEFAPPQTYMEIWAFLGLVRHYQQFIKGFAHIAQPLHKHLSQEGACKKSEWVTLMMEAKDTSATFKKACLQAPVLAFAKLNKPFLLETNASKLGLGAVLSQKQTNHWYRPVAYAGQSLTIHEHSYHSIKQGFLELKWMIAEQFQQYLLWKPFIVRTDTNLLTYIMTTPNLDATQHWWVELLARFTFSIEYQKGRDNAASDTQSQITSKLDAEIMKSILVGVTMLKTKRADAQDPAVARLMKTFKSQFRKLQFWLELPKHV